MVRFYHPDEMKRRGWMYIILGLLPIILSILLHQWLFIIFGISFIYSGVNLLSKSMQWESQIEQNKKMDRSVDITYSHKMSFWPFSSSDHSDEPVDQSKINRIRESREQADFNKYYESKKYQKLDTNPTQRKPATQNFEYCNDCGCKNPLNTIVCGKCGQNQFR